VTCETALAEAEVEYEERTSPSVYVKFRVTDKSVIARRASGPTKQSQEIASVASLPRNDRGNTYFIIWTTTPWTLLGNTAIAVHPEMEYAILEADNEKLVVLDGLAEALLGKLKKPYRVIKKVKGKELEGIECKHPFIDRVPKVVLADYVSSEEGTGCVHIAPGHGQADYLTGKKYNLPMIMPVDPKGVFDKTCGEFSGLSVHKANPKIIERLRKDKMLLSAENITHSYPHCWRCKEPIIFRATKQYFAGIDHKDLRKRMLETIKKDVKWYPEIGRSRISAMVENRPDWCLSRQRYWGVPIPAFKCKSCEEVLLSHPAIGHVARIIEREGTEAWFNKNEKALLPEGARCGKCGSADLIKETDIIDVWFESGVSYQAVLKGNRELDFPCGLYLEGSDQHRGWFQSSLITSSAIEKRAPYKGVLTHGFVVDGEGKKMSKSLGNVISPEEVMKKYGADILRLWVASSNYRDDVRLSEEILERLADAYRKIRNTFKFLLGNVNDFDPKKNAVKTKDLPEIDRWMLSRLAGVIEDAERNYSGYAFYKVFRSVYNFCVYEISSLYLDILKDRLYTFGKNSPERRSGQTVLYEILTALLKILAPVLSFTAEEAWRELFPEEESVHLSRWHWEKGILAEWRDEALEAKWARLLEIREATLKALEEKRISNEIKSPLEARALLYSDTPEFKKFLKENARDLPALFITSQVEISDAAAEGAGKCANLPLSILIAKAKGKKCSRCWNYRETTGSDKKFTDICARCAKVIHKLKEE
jgi:isoleucyl-tRNA synthetase